MLWTLNTKDLLMFIECSEMRLDLFKLVWLLIKP